MLHKTPDPAVMIRPASVADAASIVLIYNHYIEHTTVTAEQESLCASDMAERIQSVLSEKLPWLVLQGEHGLIGYAYASKWRSRIGYRYSVECSVYLAPQQSGRGYGFLLLQQLFSVLNQAGYHAVIAGIGLPNAASVALHEKLGMKKVAHFQEVVTKFGQWLDVGYWQLVFDQSPQAANTQLSVDGKTTV
ncbi:GNAT family N-acetyltransferase [Rheinheimera sp.]|uniref:GNAT family N-acetyltransferase n=1 Tax=Rheinheimera sp. TaxID=1869214 RepID=UPI0027BAEE96|nr:GNAT family N-acetyltransferase [Rheinheimera sp.]